MLNLICEKCTKKFSSKQGLEFHKNKKNPCDRILKCDKCSKVFKQKNDLARHINRKKSCLSEAETIRLNLLQLEIEKEKTNRIEIKSIKKLEESAKKLEEIELKSAKKIEERNKILEEIELKSVKDLEKIEARSVRDLEKLNTEKEIIELRSKRKIKLERERTTQYKERRNTRVNNIDNSVTINNPTIIIYQFSYTNTMQHVEEILGKGFDSYGNLIGDEITVKNNIIMLLKLLYNDNNSPKYKNIMFCNNKFFVIQSNNTWKETEYDNVKDTLIRGIKKIITPFMEKYRNIANMLDQDNKNSRMFCELIGCNKLIGCKKIKSEKKILEYTKHALDPDNGIKKIKSTTMYDENGDWNSDYESDY